MTIKKIYLIRHGESVDNSLNLESRDDTPLSEEGIRQAKYLEDRFSDIIVDEVISSPFVRTRQTIENIAFKKNLPITFSDLFVERRVPSENFCNCYDSEEVKKVYNTLKENYFISDARYSDEETFGDIKQRAKEALNYIESLEFESILISTHGMFLTMLIACMIFGDEVSPREFTKLFSGLKNSNTGITWCEFTAEAKKDDHSGWKLLVWNDQAHLG